MNAIKILLLAGSAASLLTAAWGQDAADIFADGRPLRYSNNARPYFDRGTPMVAVRETADQLGLRVDRSDSGRDLRLRNRRDELEFRQGTREYLLNGRRRTMAREPQNRRAILYVPMELFRDLTDARLEARRANREWDDRPGDAIDRELIYRGRVLRFDGNESLFLRRNTLYVPLRALAARTDVRVDRDRSGNNLVLTRGRDRIEYENGREHYRLNNRTFRMGEPSQEVRGLLFVPIELFQALVGNDLRVGGFGLPDWDGRPGGTRPGWPGSRPGDRPNLPGRDEPVELVRNGRRLDFDDDVRPFRARGVIYVPLRNLADELDVDVERSDSGRQIRLRRGQNALVYRQGDRSYEFNNRDFRLPAASVGQRGVLFVPLQLFDFFGGRDISVIRR